MQHTLEIVLGAGLVAAGLAILAVAVVRARHPSAVLAFFTDADEARPAEVTPEEELPSIVERVMQPLARRVTERVRSLYPSSYLDRLHRQLLQAGLAQALRAEEFATLQAVGIGIALLVSVALLASAHHHLGIRFLFSVVLVGCAVMLPSSWLSRRVRQRADAIERELPDVLDLLTIAVESGLGLEQAMETATADFDSAMSQELARTLQEMNLGLSRHDALQNLKDRTECADLVTFVLVLTQADVLGMPIGRVLRTQADEMRERRRARAKEKAAKLPVKILFPLMFFILPPLMIVVMGPAVVEVMKVMKYL